MSTYDPFDLASQQRTKQETAERNKLTHDEEIDDIKWLMGSKRGRRIVWRLLERTGVFRSSFTGNSETFYREGMRNIGLVLMAQTNEAGPDLYASMVKEHQQNVRNTDSGTN